MIKRSILITILFSGVTSISIAQVNDAQTLMTVGDHAVTLNEFKAMYYNNLSKDSLKNPKALDNYLQLFVEFRLKVSAAMDSRLDTTTSFKQEMKEYRDKLVDPKMRDTTVENQLIKEAYERTKWDVRAEHILIKVSPDASPADSLAAYKKIMKIRDMIVKDDTSFEAAAMNYSEDTYSKNKGGDLGYFTGLGMVYPFETVAFNSKVGEVSKPVRTQFGYHIIKVLDKRPDVGQIEVAHIMIRTNPKMTPADSMKAKAKADSIYMLAKQGQDFGDLVKKFSQDQSSAHHGGTIPWFGVGRMSRVPEFEKAAFSLQNVGDIAGPVKTSYGWHIIKLEGKKPIQPFDSVKDAITARVMKDGRSDLAVDALVDEVKKKYDFKEFPDAKKEFAHLIDSSFYKGKWNAGKASGHIATMFSLGENNYTQADFARFVALPKNQMNGEFKGGEYAVNVLYPKFVKQEVLQFKNDNLEKEDPKFAEMLMQYKDGILLFDITDQMVWSKALKDTTGLKAFYEMHKSDYNWPQRCDASIYTCSTKDVAKEVRKMISDGKIDKEILTAINTVAAKALTIANNKYVKNDNALVDANWKKGMSDDIEKDGKVVFVNVREILPPQGKILDETRGLATTDYQNYLMDQWLKDLRAKYPVKVNQQVLAQVIPK
jgi:peptidyl-prolyl cis-trans isomerase SurA